jgi:hypothetical protein
VVSTDQLLSALGRRRELLHALPGVVGTGIGIRDGRPIVEVSVAGRENSDLETTICELVEFDVVVVFDSPIPTAQAPGERARSDDTGRRE